MINNKFSSLLANALIVAVMLLSVSPVWAELLYVVNSQSRTLSRIDTATDAVNNTFAQLGNVPNKVLVDEDYLWVVLSGDNAVQKISRNSGASLGNIFIGLGSNPWDAVLHDGYLYVSGLIGNKVYKVDLQSNGVVASIQVGTAPEDMLVHNNKLYVTNAGNYLQNYAGSSVSVIDLVSFSVIANIPVPANPQYLANHNGLLHVSCTGNWADISGSVCIINPETNSVIHTIPLGGTPGCLWMADTELALVGDSNGAVLYSYNPSTYQALHDSGNPLPNGGSEVVGNSEVIAVLKPNWGSNGIVELLHQDLSPWKQYSVAMMPTDLKLYAQPSETDDQVASINSLSVYPNPLSQGAELKFSSPKYLQGELVIYNLKGQKVLSQPYNGKELCLSPGKLASGVYFYRLHTKGLGSEKLTGKLLHY